MLFNVSLWRNICNYILVVSIICFNMILLQVAVSWHKRFDCLARKAYKSPITKSGTYFPETNIHVIHFFICRTCHAHRIANPAAHRAKASPTTGVEASKKINEIPSHVTKKIPKEIISQIQRTFYARGFIITWKVTVLFVLL